MGKGGKGVRPVFFLIPILLVGLAVRLMSGNAVIQTDLVYSPGIEERVPGAGTPEDAVKSFYLLIDRGGYEKAYELVLEPDWTPGETPALYRENIGVREGTFPGWTGKAEFVERLRRELGASGTWITLNSVRAESISQHPEADVSAMAERYELSALESVYTVEVSGNLLGACTIFKWKKVLPVLQIGKNYRVLLSGTKAEKKFYYQSWFSELEKVGYLRAPGKEK